MPIRNSYYANLERDLTENDGLPVISQDLDAVRAYQWEVTFFPPALVDGGTPISKPLTLAAKTISAFGMKVGDIETHRVNDRVYYPGKIEYDEFKVTFDNLLATKTGHQIYKFFTSVWDPETGEYASTFQDSPGNFKTDIEVIELNGRNDVVQVIKLKGAYPKQITKAEKNYSSVSDFDTIEVSFRFDFMVVEGDTTA